MAFFDFLGLCTGDRKSSAPKPSKSSSQIFNCSSARDYPSDEDIDSPPRRKIKGLKKSSVNLLYDGSTTSIPGNRKVEKRPTIDRSQSARDPPRGRGHPKPMVRQHSEKIRSSRKKTKLKPKTAHSVKKEIDSSQETSLQDLSTNSKSHAEEAPQRTSRPPSPTPSQLAPTTEVERSSSKSSLVAAPDVKLAEDQTVNRWGHVMSKTESNGEEKSAKEKQKILQKETERESKWLQMIKEWDRKPGQPIAHPKLKERIRKGISDSVRGTVWSRLAEATSAFESDRLLYPRLLKEKLPREHEIQIRKDLPRAFQTHVMFRSPVPGSRSIVCKGQIRLYNVLKAYAIFDPEVGYVQGMGEIAGLCLMYMSEEKSFWMMERILKGERYKLRDLYTNGMPLVFKYMYILDRLVKQHLPKLHTHFEQIGVKPMDYSLKWLTTRFSDFPTALVIRVFEIFLNEGMKFLFRLSLYLLQSFEKELLTMNFEEVCMFLRDLPTNPAMENTDTVLFEALKINLKRAEIEKICEDYKPTTQPSSPTATPSSTTSSILSFASSTPPSPPPKSLLLPSSPTTTSTPKEVEFRGGRSRSGSSSSVGGNGNSLGRRKSISEMIFVPKSPNICYSD